MQTTQQDKTVSTYMQTTQQMTDVAHHDNTVSACYLYRRKRKSQQNIAVEGNVNPQYEDLNATRLSSCYSSLNAPTVTCDEEQYEHVGIT
ncbi:hypothetical protein AM593_07417, partial [Mytilus galloprovincialis]